MIAYIHKQGSVCATFNSIFQMCNFKSGTLNNIVQLKVQPKWGEFVNMPVGGAVQITRQMIFLFDTCPKTANMVLDIFQGEKLQSAASQ